MGASRKLIAFTVALAGLAAACAGASGSPAPVENPWLDQRGILNMAHQGGEMEAPSSTIYAFRTALEDRGADSLEMDVNATEDGRLAVMHDYYTGRITPQDSQLRDLTLAELQALDAAWWFTPGEGQFDHSLPASSYPFRGVRTGDVPPPEGYTAQDFRVPSIEEVLAAFPRETPLNIEIKSVPGDDGEAIRVAKLLAEVLNRPENADRPIIVTSLVQNAIVTFHELAPQVDLGASVAAMIDLIAGGERIQPESVALQVPMFLGELEPALMLQEMDVRSLGYAVHAWTVDRADEKDATYARLIETGVQGIISSAPSRLADYLCRAGVRRPDGRPRCDSQVMEHRLTFPSRSLRQFLTKGLPVRATCDQDCRPSIRVRVKNREAKRLGLRVVPRPGRGMTTIGAGPSVELSPRSGSGVYRVRPFPGRFKPLARARRVTVEVTVAVSDGYGWGETVERRWLTLKSKRPLRRK